MDTPSAPILILATEACAYPGADAVGQAHLTYPANTYIMRVPSPVIFPESFYYRAFERGIAGIIVMSCGVECPFQGAYEKLAARIDRVYVGLRDRGMNPKRLKLCSICTVCTQAFLKEVASMEEVVQGEEVAAA